MKKQQAISIGIILIIILSFIFLSQTKFIFTGSGNFIKILNEDKETFIVKIKEQEFYPEILQIKKGGSITFVNEKEKECNLKNNNRLLKELENKENYSMQFNQQGTFRYYCDLNSSINIEIIII